jgi:hypothetical protein
VAARFLAGDDAALPIVAAADAAAIVFTSGTTGSPKAVRPVLLAPAKPPVSIGDRIAFGWDGSAEAVRAMTEAPLSCFLAMARETLVIPPAEQLYDTVGSVIDYLAWHDVKARYIHVHHIPS